MEPIKKTEKGVIQLFETSKKGDRFRETVLKFGDTNSEKRLKHKPLLLTKLKNYRKSLDSAALSQVLI